MKDDDQKERRNVMKDDDQKERRNIMKDDDQKEGRNIMKDDDWKGRNIRKMMIRKKDDDSDTIVTSPRDSIKHLTCFATN